jgi:hypothetical protein
LCNNSSTCRWLSSRLNTITLTPFQGLAQVLLFCCHRWPVSIRITDISPHLRTKSGWLGTWRMFNDVQNMKRPIGISQTIMCCGHVRLTKRISTYAPPSCLLSSAIAIKLNAGHATLPQMYNCRRVMFGKVESRKFMLNLASSNISKHPVQRFPSHVRIYAMRH